MFVVVHCIGLLWSLGVEIGLVSCRSPCGFRSGFDYMKYSQCDLSLCWIVDVHASSLEDF